MSEWDSVISVIGTVIGTLVGLLVGYWISSRIETERQKYEMNAEYRRELTKHMDDIIKPLFHFVEELWGSIAILRESVRMKSPNVEDSRFKTHEAEQNLKHFYTFNYSQMSLLLPHSLSPWVFAPIEERLNKALVKISDGKEPEDQEFTLVINALMKYQKNLKKLLGYETEEKLENIYPFT